MKLVRTIVGRQKYNLILIIAVWSIYVVHVVPGGGVNPNRYFDLIHSIVHHQTLTIDAYQENTIDKAFKDGHYYSAGLPGPSVIGLPSYLAFAGFYKLVPARWLAPLSAIQSFQQGAKSGFYQQDNVSFFLSTIWITWFTLSLLSAVSTVVLYHLCIRLGLPSHISLIAAGIYAFGTPVFFFSTTYFSHVFNASTCILALYALFCWPVERVRVVALVGLVAGLSILIEYQGLILICALGLYVWYRYGFRMAVWYAGGALIPIALLLLYNYVTLGSPFAVPHAWLADNNRDKVHGVGLLGFTFPHLDYLLGLLIMPEYGLFIYSPVLLLAPIGWFHACHSANARVRDMGMISFGAALVAVLWAGSYAAWNGGATFGPRQIVSALPFFTVGTAFGLARLPRLIWLPLIILSVLTNWLGAQFGFAHDVFEHWRTFIAQGFALPWMLAITSHSRTPNMLFLVVTKYAWVIDLAYVTLVIVNAIAVQRIHRLWQQARIQTYPDAFANLHGSEKWLHTLPETPDRTGI